MTRSLLLAIAFLPLVATPSFGEPREEPPPDRSKLSLMPADIEPLSKDKRETTLAKGEAVYGRVCARCHDKGISGAPKLGDREAWRVRIPTGTDVLVRHAIEGYEGNLGVHPPRGGDRNLSDAEVEAAVHYMVEQCREEPARR